MTDTPERIWAFEQSGSHVRLWRANNDRKGSHEYVRSDIADAAVLAERGKWLEALTPSDKTKAAYMGEFTFPTSYFDAGDAVRTLGVSVPWVIIEEIMKAIRERATEEGK